VPALATAPRAVTTTTFAVGRFGNIDANTLTDLGRGQRPRVWRAGIRTRGASDLYVLQNTIAPGGTFGWHSHPGPSLVIVKSGTATF
jgi:quercetin dioxygenase-like cupin family protein